MSVVAVGLHFVWERPPSSGLCCSAPVGTMCGSGSLPEAADGLLMHERVEPPPNSRLCRSGSTPSLSAVNARVGAAAADWRLVHAQG